MFCFPTVIRQIMELLLHLPKSKENLSSQMRRERGQGLQVKLFLFELPEPYYFNTA